MIYAGRLGEAAVADRVGLDLPDCAGSSRARAGPRHGAVDDLEIASTRDFLNLTRAKSGSMPVVS
jgi:hypothetical protein